MIRGISRIVTHRSAGVIWSLTAIGLAAALAATSLAAHRKEDFLRGRIAALASRDASPVRAELVSCQASLRAYGDAAAVSAPRRTPRPGEAMRVKETEGDPAGVAAELANTSPVGLDSCARMESADQAVLKSLDPR